MPVLRSRNAAMLVKAEATPGVFVAPSAATDGVLVENPRASFDPQNVDTNEVTGSLDTRGPIIGGLQAKLDFTVYLKGNGVPGTAPQWDTLMKICGWGSAPTVSTIAGATFATNGGTSQITDSANGLAVLTVGTPLHVSGFANSANSGEFLVTASAAGAITLSKVDGSGAGLVTEAAGAAVTIRYGVAAVAATAGTTTS